MLLRDSIMKKLLFFFIILFTIYGIPHAFAQQFADKEYYLVDSLNLEELTQTDRHLLDSCLTVYHEAQQDTDRINSLNNVCDFLVHDVWSDYQFVQYKLIMEALKNNPNEKVKHNLEESLSASLNNIGLYYEKNKGNSSKALEYYHKSLKLHEKLDNQDGVAQLLNRVGQIYVEQGDDDKGLEYFQKSLKLFKDLNEQKEISNPLNNLGLYYEKKGDHPKALEYFNESLEIDQKTGNQQGTAISLSNIGRVYNEQKKYSKALIFFIKGLKIFENMGDRNGVSLILNNIGHVYYVQGDLKSAEFNAKMSYDIAKEIGFPVRISGSALLLSQVYEKQNRKGEALDMFKLYTSVKDSMTNENTKMDAVRQQSKYEYEKQKAVDDAIYDKQLAIQEQSREKQRIIIYAIGGGLTLLVIFLLFVFHRLRITRKQKEVIESQKIHVEKANEMLSVKNKEILDSITYAKRIQTAILPQNKLVKEHLKDSFILYKPKDIVAGDFYWMKNLPQHSLREGENSPPSGNLEEAIILFAVADCTGHGVPGAMVSVVCNNGLNRSINEYGLNLPGEILDKTREIVIEEFSATVEEENLREDYVKDGMDIALCSLRFKVKGSRLKENKKTLKPEHKTAALLQYAGANNPLWIITSSPKGGKNDSEKTPLKSPHGNRYLHEIKANKQPIGFFRRSEPFTTHTIELQKGDTIYIFSDGYVDQFGGEKGKKFKAKAFKKLLLSIQDKTMEQQKIIIDETFENWRGNLEQIDDVCVIGVRV